MKILRLTLLFSAMILVAASCSKKDNSTPQPPVVTPPDEEEPAGFAFFPYQSGDKINFDNSKSIEGEDEPTTSSESVEVTAENPLLFTSEITDGDFQGLFTRALNDGQVKIDDGKLIYTGNLSLYVVDEEQSVQVGVKDIVLFDENAKAGDVIYSDEDGESENDFEIVVAGTMTSHYTLTVTQGEAQDLEVNGTTYQDVIPVVLKLDNLSMNFAIDGVKDEEGTPANADITEEGDNEPLILTNYFAKDKGLVKSVAELDVPFRSLLDIANEITGGTFEGEDGEAQIEAVTNGLTLDARKNTITQTVK